MVKNLTTVVLLILILGFVSTGHTQEPFPSLNHYQTFYAPVLYRTCLSGCSGVQSRPRGERIPPIRFTRIAGEFLVGGGLCMAGRYISLGLLDYFKITDGKLSSCDLALALLSLNIACSLGSSTGVYLVGSLGNETGSFPATVIYSSWGFWAGCLTLLYLSPETAPFIGAVCGAIRGFSDTRRYKTMPVESETALINFRDGQMSLAVPIVSFLPEPLGRKGLAPSVDLLKVSF